MEMTELGMVILAKSLQSKNANSPIAVTVLGMLILVRLVRKLNAHSPMLMMELGIVVFMQPINNVLVAVSIIALQLSRESNTALPLATVMLVSPVQPLNAE